MTARIPRLPLVAATLLAVSLGPNRIAASDAVQYQDASHLSAASFLPAERLHGPEWSVADEVSNDGFVNTYTLTSRYGTWQARGALALEVRIGEIEALAELDRISKSSVFLDAVKRSAVGQVETVASFVTQPVDTVKAIPGGVKRWFQKTSYRASETYHDVREKAAEDDASTAEGSSGEEGKDSDGDKAKEVARKQALDYLNVSAAERRWYAQLGVDPYTDNQTLRQAIKSYARIEGLTSFGMKFVGIPSIPGVGAMRRTMDLVWNTDPWELRRRNRKLLLGMGLSEEAARGVEDNPSLSLTMQTLLVDSLEALGGVTGRDTLVARATEVPTRDDARLLVQSVALLERLHAGPEPLAAFLGETRVPVARTLAGGLAAATPADAFFWTADMATAAQAFAAAYAAESAASRRLWLVGEASPRFRAEAARLGWDVRDRWKLPAAPAAAGTAPRP